ncbi:hypothetical protein ARMSODRAFT_221294 [Armillaria solidipes]|uniref:Uncharacterized protein n=1 Tax=Armillaria solidipes TaxID=1076256 RepID=A0A2H3BZN3_9AGAR|nr:hypothetical protein ARMSODRAFT_221294 [Armillaria solidipes]
MYRRREQSGRGCNRSSFPLSNPMRSCCLPTSSLGRLSEALQCQLPLGHPNTIPMPFVPSYVDVLVSTNIVRDKEQRVSPVGLKQERVSTIDPDHLGECLAAHRSQFSPLFPCHCCSCYLIKFLLQLYVVNLFGYG